MNAERTKDIEALTLLWVAAMPTIPPPPVSQFELWFEIHNGNFGAIVYGLEELAGFYQRRRGVLGYNYAVRYGSRCMNAFSRRKKSAYFPLNILTKDMADKLGLPVGMALSEEMYWKCQLRILAMDNGRVPKPITAAQAAMAKNNEERSIAA
jgi:hypothetical protein